MMYVNFTDSNNLPVIDRLGYDFLVRDSMVRITRNLKLNEIKDLVDNYSLRYSFYLYALYDDETIKEDLSNYILSGGNLSVNYSSGVRQKLSINIFNPQNNLPNAINKFLWKGSKFKLEISVRSTSTEYVYPAGVFILENFDIPHKHNNNMVTLELVDKFGGLDGTVGGKIVDNIYIARGSNIVEVIKSLLKSEKISGYYYDYKTPLFPSWCYGETTPFTITESSDSTIGALIIKLASIINLDVFYDEYGRMCFEEMEENVVKNTMPSLWTFSDDTNIFESHSTKIDLQAVENVIVVEGANINGDIISVRVENVNPKSPTNITTFEPKICKITDENIADTNSAHLRANYELFKRSLLPISLSFSTILIPLLDVNKVITINDSYCGFVNSRFLITSIDIPITETVKVNMSISNLEEVAFSG